MSGKCCVRLSLQFDLEFSFLASVRGRFLHLCTSLSAPILVPLLLFFPSFLNIVADVKLQLDIIPMHEFQFNFRLPFRKRCLYLKAAKLCSQMCPS